MPFVNFAALGAADDAVLDFFQAHFADVVPLMGADRLVADFRAARPQHLVSVKCRPFHLLDRALLLGDAAHAMVPFYGQGMNAGFEDCSLLGRLCDRLLVGDGDGNGDSNGTVDDGDFGDDSDVRPARRGGFGGVLEAFSRQRCRDAHTICDLAMYNYVEMRDLVTRKSFRMRKRLDESLFRLAPARWVPLYNAVSFSTMPYEECWRQRQWQDRMLCGAMLTLAGLALVACAWLVAYACVGVASM